MRDTERVFECDQKRDCFGLLRLLTTEYRVQNSVLGIKAALGEDDVRVLDGSSR